jgi:hypothetical protein
VRLLNNLKSNGETQRLMHELAKLVQALFQIQGWPVLFE